MIPPELHGKVVRIKDKGPNGFCLRHNEQKNQGDVDMVPCDPADTGQEWVIESDGQIHAKNGFTLDHGETSRNNDMCMNNWDSRFSDCHKDVWMWSVDTPEPTHQNRTWKITKHGDHYTLRNSHHFCLHHGNQTHAHMRK
mgnify:FL=1